MMWGALLGVVAGPGRRALGAHPPWGHDRHAADLGPRLIHGGSVPHLPRILSRSRLESLCKTSGRCPASLDGPFGLLAVLLKRRLQVLRIDLLHVANRLAAHQLLRYGDVLPDTPMHKLGRIFLHARNGLKQFAV